MPKQFYLFTLKILCPYNPDESVLEDSGVVVDAESGESMVIGREVNPVSLSFVREMSGEFFDHLIDEEEEE